jgi:hypothetical protein
MADQNTPADDTSERKLTCPSASPDMENVHVLGVMEPGPDGPRLSYINSRVPVTDDLLSKTGDVPPTKVFRFSGDCMNGGCRHFEGGKCGLSLRMPKVRTPTVDHLPPGVIRKTCRWYDEAGAEACLRCSQVVTWVDEATPEMRQILRPDDKV